MLLIAPLLLLGCDKETKTETTPAEKKETTEVVKTTSTKSEIHGVNQITHAKEWYPTTDEFGSSLDTGKALITEGELKVGFTITKKVSDDKWPYVEVICKPKAKLVGTESVNLTYKCDKTLLVIFSLSDFNHLGDESYAHF